MSNVISFTGACGKDAEVRYLPSGAAVLNVPVANSVGYGDNQKTIWFRVAFWGNRATKIVDYLKKGQKVFISGELSFSEYEKDGAMAITNEVNANVIDLIGKKDDSSQDSNAQQSTRQQQPAQPQPQNRHNESKSNGYAPSSAYDDDIPF
jgi:single-strand DNA-binding protein